MTDLQLSLKYYQNKRPINIYSLLQNRLHLCMGDEKTSVGAVLVPQMVTPVEQCLSDFEGDRLQQKYRIHLSFQYFS